MSAMPEPPSAEQSAAILSVVKWVTGIFFSFVGGVITAAWVVRGYVDRLVKIEEFQKNCSGETIKKMDRNIDWIVKTGLREVHERIDSIKDGKK